MLLAHPVVTGAASRPPSIRFCCRPCRFAAHECRFRKRCAPSTGPVGSDGDDRSEGGSRFHRAFASWWPLR